MSYHASLNPEAEARFRAQRRNSTIASFIIGLLIIFLMGLIFWAIAIPYFSKETQPIVAYNAPIAAEETVEKVKVTTSVVKKPTQSSSSSAVKVTVAKNASSTFSVPTPDTPSESLSLDFGASEGFGQGWGSSGSGFGQGGGSFNFMGSKMSGDRVCFIIDYSQSMKAKDKITLLKNELLETVENLPSGMNFNLQFFAGPTWHMNDKLTSFRNNFSMESEGKTYNWKKDGWVSKSNKPIKRDPEWSIMTPSRKEEILEIVRDTPLCYGTSWEPPLKEIFTMKPLPDLIVFLTDGLAGGNPEAVAQKYGELAKKEGVKINTISLMEPKARDSMALMAELSGGDFSLIDANGEKVEQK
ncbi:hypothetical protein OAB00_03045 [Akkermansiaceae bacterium]|nr:hypothetical protein [Akkermansiaceae bacterium]